ncbi:hypothetical protein EYZ11_003316 [Aspergillus tanneri]|uniref:carbonic anhydrase n=1 Tax=Aspergillus tanneri TaxID=1220188 RepID=A0A4S3JQR3_9EURO|nr:uncharacterized protein ATNIH1004_001748 [Aspergillus tanneri]KAA8652839.1 hypothetical protein ATNIH1004_001748 [Aspergillus tanneri]THC97207.1 hypothetical protein EYZ11_003316 [Aspergillus tanneri]
MKLLLIFYSLVTTTLSYPHFHIERDARQAQIANYTYAGESGPLHWHYVDPENSSICATGRTQSPIDISSEDIDHANHGSLHLNIPSTNGSTLENTGSGLQVSTNGSLTLENRQYQLAQLNFHTPSEHRVNGEYFPMELHFSFRRQQETAVVGFLFQISENQTTFHPFDSIFNHVGEVTEPGTSTITGSIAFSGLEAHFDRNYIYNYTGSLTTPPCTEEVQWFLSEVPLPLSVPDYNNVKKVVKFNSRYTQNELGNDNLLA